MKYTHEQLFKKITDWEFDAGESFYDKFCHDNISALSYGMYLIGKGYLEHGNKIIDLYLEDTCVDQEEQYQIYPEYEYDETDYESFNDENCDKNLDIMIQFLLDSKNHYMKLERWFKKNNL